MNNSVKQCNNICKGITKTKNKCTRKALENGYCSYHQSIKKVNDIKKNGKNICNNYVRGCFEILDNNYEYNYCVECRLKRRLKETTRRNKKEAESLEYNNKNKNTNMCIKCKQIYDKNTKTGNKCYDCYNKYVLSEYKRANKNPYLAKYQGYKLGAKKRNLEFNLSQEEAIKMYFKNCYYCNKISTVSHINGIDRINSDKNYDKDNCVPCCIKCNRMKSNYSVDKFLNIIKIILKNRKLIDENVQPNEKLFKRKETNDYDKYKKSIDRIPNNELHITKDEYYEITTKNCYYCGNFSDGCNGIDRIDSALSYYYDNCVPCCWTCNLMKNNYDEDFIPHIKNIYDFYVKNIDKNKLSEKDKILLELSKANFKIKKLRKEKFLYKKNYYEKLTWNEGYDELKNIIIKLDFCEDEKSIDIWNYYRLHVSSFNNNQKNPHQNRNLKILVKDDTTKKYLGIMSLSEAYKNIENRDLYIGWKNKEKHNNLKYIMNMSTCVPLQPFGFNYNGGKLLANLIFSKEIYNKIYEKYNIKLLGIETYGLNGKSVMYSRIKKLKFLGLTKGFSYCKFTPKMVNLCKEYLYKNHNIDSSNRFIILNRICEKLHLPKDIILKGENKGVYFGFYNKKFNGEKLNTIQNITTIFNDWLNIADKRYKHLKKTKRVKRVIPNKNIINSQKYIDNKKKELGTEKYLESKRIYQTDYYNKTKKTLANKTKNYDVVMNKIKEELNKAENKTNILPLHFTKVFTSGKYHIYFDKRTKDKRYTAKMTMKSSNIENELKRIIDKVYKKYPELKDELVIPDRYINEINNDEQKIKENIEKSNKKNFTLPKCFSIITEKNLKYLLFQKNINKKRYAKKYRLVNDDIETHYLGFKNKIIDNNPELKEFLDENQTKNEDNVLPKNFFITKINNQEYLKFDKMLKGKKYCARIKVNNLMEDLNTLKSRIKTKHKDISNQLLGISL